MASVRTLHSGNLVRGVFVGDEETPKELLIFPKEPEKTEARGDLKQLENSVKTCRFSI